MLHRHTLFALALLLVIAASALMGCGEETPQGLDKTDNDPPVADTTPPSAVADLIVQVATRNTLALQWPAPGDDGDEGQAAAYDLRYSFSTVTDDNWDAATPVDDVPDPGPGGSVEVFVVKGLTPGIDYYFALKTCDEVPNESGLSNCAHGTTVAEIVPPAAVDDLHANATSDTEFELTWTATGDDGMEGTATAYDIRYSVRPMTAQEWSKATRVENLPAPAPPGASESLVVTGLNAGTNYYFALEVIDDALNRSEMSNSAPGMALSEILLVNPSLVPADYFPAGIYVVFRSHSATERIEVTVSRKEWNSQFREYRDVVKRHLVDGNFEPGAYVAVWDWTNDAGSVFSWTFSSVTIKLYVDEALVASKEARMDQE
jgi:hypothetical protein